MTPHTSRVEKFLTKRHPIWVRLVVSLSFLMLPFIAAFFDVVFDNFLSSGEWRIFSLAPIIILYIWIVSPAISRGEAQVVRSIRSMMQLDDENFAVLIDRESRVRPRNVWLTIALGGVLGLISARTSSV